MRQALRHAASRRRPTGPAGETERLILLRAAPQWRGAPAIAVDTQQGRVTADVRGCPTVLSVLDALSQDRDPRTYLVVLTPQEYRELGDSILAQAISHEVKPIDRWDLLLEAFGARRLDPRLLRAEYRWLAEALLEAQPSDGWRRIPGRCCPPIPSLGRLAGPATWPRRRGRAPGRGRPAGLEPGRDPGGPVPVAAPGGTGRARGLAGDLGRPVAGAVFRLLGEGQVTDAVPFGLVVA